MSSEVIITFLKPETALAMASESALAKDWLLPEEDRAWEFL
jgi:hypothetical protein